MIGYHGSQTRITTLDSTRDLCLSTDWAAARSYAHYDKPTGGYLHTVATDAHLADEDELREAAAAVHGRPIEGEEHSFVLADEPGVRAHLAAEGFEGVEYTDHDQDGVAHDCVRVWNTATVTITDCSDIED